MKIIYLAAFLFPILGLYVAMARSLVGGVVILAMSLVYAFVGAFCSPKKHKKHSEVRVRNEDDK